MQPARTTGVQISRLTTREREVLELLATGATNSDIAAVLDLAEGTVRNVIARITAKLGVADRTQAALLAARVGLGARLDADSGPIDTD